MKAERRNPKEAEMSKKNGEPKAARRKLTLKDRLAAYDAKIARLQAVVDRLTEKRSVMVNEAKDRARAVLEEIGA